MNTTTNHTEQETFEKQAPALYQVVCHADTGLYTDLAAVRVISHVIQHHAGVTSEVAAVTHATKAVRYGREIIRFNLTKEVGETILRECSQCEAQSSFRSFQFVLEIQK